MRNVLPATAAVLLFAACTSVRPPGPTSTPTQPPVRITVLGDSLAFGTGASEPTGGFAFRIYEQIARTRPGSEITSVAIGGTTVADVERLEVARLRGTKPDLVLLCVGGNDVVRRTDPARFAASYAAVVAQITRTVPHARLVIFGVPDVSVSPLFADFDASLVGELSRRDDRAVRAIARHAGASFVDLFALSRQARASSGFFSSDQFHPSDAGHERIARLALPTIRRALGG